ncbi:heterokaryon incompatibility protein-domain-containing protein [Daldinia grandis]|nr:heterokaryon incompatibility protein-domain-containing protein [Daldinia grandis]
MPLIKEQPTPVNLDDEGSTSRSPGYPYQELSGTDIRLVRILPGDDPDGIECLVDLVPLSSKPDYHALSYVWGDPSDPRTITLNGRPFDITGNFHEVLRQFRQFGRLDDYLTDYIWADAICINQDDAVEKSREVPRMAEIYKSAMHVPIWLGPCAPSTGKSHLGKLLRKTTSNKSFSSEVPPLEIIIKPTAAAISTEDDVIEDIMQKFSSFLGLMPADSCDDEKVLRSVFGSSYNALIETTANILVNPWFSRTWTIQEACISPSPTFYIGRHHILEGKLEILTNTLTAIYKPLLITTGSKRMKAIQRIQDMFLSVNGDFYSPFNPSEMTTPEVFARLLVEAQDKESQDPRDQIYGILGLLKFLGKDIPAELMPDYNEPYEDLYWKCTAYVLGSTGDLRLLGCIASELEIGTRPSWVTDFRYLIYMEQRLKCQPSVSISPDNRTLILHGILIGSHRNHVNWSWDVAVCPLEKMPKALPSRLREMEEKILIPSAEINGMAVEECLDGFAKTAIGIFNQWGLESYQRTFRKLCNTYSKMSSKSRKKMYRDQHTLLYSLADEFKFTIMLLSSGTIVRLLKQETEVQPGDLVCLFKGASQASVVRPCGDGYLFVSQCHIRTQPLASGEYNEEFWAGRELTEFRLV